VDVNVRTVGLENETGSHVTRTRLSRLSYNNGLYDNADRRQTTDDNDERQTMTTSTYDEDEAMLMSLPVDALHYCGKLLTDWV